MINIFNDNDDDCPVQKLLKKDNDQRFKDVENLYKSMNLKENQRMCPMCKEILTTNHTHDLVVCSCGYLALDGGLHYQRVMLFY